MARSRILIIEDHADTRRFLESMLSREFETLSAENAVLGIDLARNQHPDLILLDIMLPILSGHDACGLLKDDEKTRNIPIVFISAKNTTSDIAKGLAKGADDYIGKPFDIKELIARVHVRLKKQGSSSSQPLQIGELKIHATEREVSFSGKKIKLTNTEFDILRFLAMSAGKIVSRADIQREVWRSEDRHNANDRTIDVHIRALRRKIPEMTKHIISIYGVGYKYEE
ncbi:MAG: response regulator transcription factor [Bdellovibrionales bacterium]|nr:response regulator transcription factor [Bdellovibrionales bacterium]